MLAAAALGLLATLLTAAAVAPSAIATVRARREFDLQLSRRAQLGERLAALVEGLADLERQSQRLEAQVSRAARIYGLPEPEYRPSTVAPPQSAPRETIFGGLIGHGRRTSMALESRLDRLDGALAEIVSWEREHPEEAELAPLRWPMTERLAVPTSGFGLRRSAAAGELEFHAGLDLAAPAGTAVVAPAAGVVLWTGEAPANAGGEWWRLGRLVVLRHGERFLTVLGHLDRVTVPRGRRIRPGESLGTVGNSGWAATPQLHYEVWRRAAGGDWHAVDPAVFLFESELPTTVLAERSSDAPGPPALPRAFRP